MMSSIYDRVLREHYETNFFGKHIPVSSFIKTFEPELSLLMRKGDLEIASAACRRKEDLPVDALRGVLQTEIGRALFSDAALRLDWSAYVTTINNRLRDVEFHDFSVGEVRSFKQICTREAKSLQSNTDKIWGKTAQPIAFCGRTVDMRITCVNDSWAFKLVAMVKSVGASTRVIPRLPWDRAVFGDGKIEGIRETVKLPEELIADSKNARQAALTLLGGTAQSISDMKAIMNANASALLSMDRSFCIELDFLNKRAGDLVTASGHSQVLAALPSGLVEKLHITHGRSVESSLKILHSDACVVGGVSLHREVEAARGMAQSLSEVVLALIHL